MKPVPLLGDEETRALSPQCENTARRLLSVNQEYESYQEACHVDTLISDFYLLELQERNVCCLSHTVFCILL